MRFGVQGFGTFRNTSEDFGELFYRIREAGYQLIEPCVSFMTIEGYERTIWPYETFKSLAAMIDSAGLKMESCHVFSGNLLANVPQMTEMAEQYGIRQFVVKTLHRFERVVEAPNWLKKEDAMLYNSDGRIWHYDIVSDMCHLMGKRWYICPTGKVIWMPGNTFRTCRWSCGS